MIDFMADTPRYRFTTRVKSLKDSGANQLYPAYLGWLLDHGDKHESILLSVTDHKNHLYILALEGQLSLKPGQTLKHLTPQNAIDWLNNTNPAGLTSIPSLNWKLYKRTNNSSFGPIYPDELTGLESISTDPVDTLSLLSSVIADDSMLVNTDQHIVKGTPTPLAGYIPSTELSSITGNNAHFSW